MITDQFYMPNPDKSSPKIDSFNYKEQVDELIKDKSKSIMNVGRHSLTQDAHVFILTFWAESNISNLKIKPMIYKGLVFILIKDQGKFKNNKFYSKYLTN